MVKSQSPKQKKMERRSKEEEENIGGIRGRRGGGGRETVQAQQLGTPCSPESQAGSKKD
jgi:hypothetical protein